MGENNQRSIFNIKDLNIPPDSERRETFEALPPPRGVLKRVLAFFLFTGVRSYFFPRKGDRISDSWNYWSNQVFAEVSYDGNQRHL